MKKLTDLRDYVLPVQIFALITLPLVMVVLWTILVSGLFSIVTNATFTDISSSNVMWTANSFFYFIFMIATGDMLWIKKN
jgi:hypothetical protein